MAKKTVIHVNQHIIKRNRTTGEREAPLTVKDYGQNRKAFEAVIRDRTGREVARVVYRPDAPLDCGAHVWIETREHVDVVDYIEQELVEDDIDDPTAVIDPERFATAAARY